MLELLLLIFTLLLSGFLFLNYQRFKKIELQRLAVILNQIEKEKQQHVTYQNTEKEINSIEKATQTKLQILKVFTINLDFTTTELFSSS